MTATEQSSPSPHRATLAHEVAAWAHHARVATENRDHAVIAMRMDGASLREIAQAAGMAHASIVRILDRGGQ